MEPVPRLENVKPPLNCSQARQLAEAYFSFRVKSISELASYDDRNFLIEVENDFRGHGKTFVLKVSNLSDSQSPGLLESVNELTSFIKTSTRIKVPYPIASTDGNLVSRLALDPSLSADMYAVRLLVFIPGTIMNQIDYTEDILSQAGQTLGLLAKQLKDFNGKYSVLDERKFIWSLTSVDQLDNYVDYIENLEHRAIVQRIVKKFKVSVLDEIGALRRAIIHGDFNEQNIIFEKDEHGKWSLIGVIDFNDAHRAPAIFDLAILCAYVTLDSKTIDPLKAPSYVIAGYQRVIKLTQHEWDILPICVLARLAQSMTLGYYSSQKDPNNKYLLSSAGKVGSVLERMASHENKSLIQLWQIPSQDDHFKFTTTSGCCTS